MRYLPASLLFALLAVVPASAQGVSAPDRHQPRAPALEPVPEPAIWPMMIAGMGFAGAVLRRAVRRPREAPGG